MKSLLIITSAFAMAVAQPPCESPPLWQAKIVEFDPSKAFARSADLFYDKANSRIAFYDDEIYQGQESIYFDVLLYAIGKSYSVNLQQGTCKISPLTTPFPVIGVPPGANLTGQYYVGVTGVPNDYLLVNRYEDFGGNYFGSWTAVGCAPLSAYVNTTRDGAVFFNFYDVQLGVSNPNVFRVPKQCA